MKVIARPLGTGKIKELMDMALEADGMILTTNKRALQVKAESYGFDSLYIIDINDLYEGNYDEDKPLFVHKLEDVMEEYYRMEFGLTLAGFSVRMEEV